MKPIFRLSKTDSVRVEAVTPSGLLLAIYTDDGYTKIAQCIAAILRKIPHYEGARIDVRITNLTKETFTNRLIRVNR